MQHSSIDRSHQEIEHPICTTCGAPTWLTRIETYNTDRDHRTFECQACGKARPKSSNTGRFIVRVAALDILHTRNIVHGVLLDTRASSWDVLMMEQDAAPAGKPRKQPRIVAFPPKFGFCGHARCALGLRRARLNAAWMLTGLSGPKSAGELS